MTMKKGTLLMVVAMLVLAILVTGCAPNTPAAETKVLVVGLDDTFAPMGFRNEKNEIVGFDVDLALEVAARNGWEIQFQPIDWAMKETELNAGNIDMIWNGYTITEERKEKVNFSDPYLANAQIIVTMAGSDIETLADLAGRAVATQAESSSLDAARAKAGFVESLKDGKLIEYATFNEVFNDLESGRTEAIIVDEVLARYYMNNKGGDAYKVLEENLGPEEFGVGVRKDDTELLDALNAALNEMKEDGTYDEIYGKWFAK
ncbi:amino acid ABC transporter substrate-binding protein [Gudongella oleilytica]|uniref:amino acid ABC transporter substrate-binding protein n=1 Tax=Gudongella oleilytica TaxID=1582259 RepID=UPI001F0BEAEF|nr:amino acid ABC transporter substrate-binding protein [Gudongella oleilytica]MDY0256841.1 amino acid ABC transporter substrate-binding protein [Gudongella oleilytica]